MASLYLQYGITVEELCEELHKPKGFIYRLIKEQRIAYIKIGRELRFSRDDVDAYYLSMRKEANHG